MFLQFLSCLICREVCFRFSRTSCTPVSPPLLPNIRHPHQEWILGAQTSHVLSCGIWKSFYKNPLFTCIIKMVRTNALCHHPFYNSFTYLESSLDTISCAIYEIFFIIFKGRNCYLRQSLPLDKSCRWIFHKFQVLGQIRL